MKAITVNTAKINESYDNVKKMCIGMRIHLRKNEKILQKISELIKK